MTNENNIKIAIIGLGYVGLPLAVEFGTQLHTLGFDTNLERIKELKLGRDSTLEVDMDLLKSASKLKYSSDISDLSGCNIFLVTVPTPIDSANRPNLTPLINATKTVGAALEPRTELGEATSSGTTRHYFLKPVER